MQLSDFDYHLPAALIACEPSRIRDQSRLLLVPPQEGDFVHQHFTDLTQYLKPNDLLVLNNTRVIKARLNGHKASGGQAELMVERILSADTAMAFIKASKAPRVGSFIYLIEARVEVLEKTERLYKVRFELEVPLLAYLEVHGVIPLPPYMQREAAAEDLERYQTVYGKHPGAVAAPTAGLHFTQDLLDSLEKNGVNLGQLTLHVGAGTFQPVVTETITEHKMHAEWLSVDQTLVDQIHQTRALGGRVVAVGTTCARALETAAQVARKKRSRTLLEPFAGESRLFIYPGFEFRVVDGLITNFHLPKSTLLMLVSALAGYEQIRAAYDEAVSAAYRFYSYGDAMFILPRSCS